MVNNAYQLLIFMSKVSVIGAGNVGATCANVLALNHIADEIVLLDVKPGVAQGKAVDIMQTAQLLRFDTRLGGYTDDYTQTAGSDLVVITSGVPRKPGMTREELIGVNATIVKDVVSKVLTHSPDAFFVVIANPMDTMTYLTLKAFSLPKHRVIGMGGALDSARFRFYLAQALEANPNDLEAMVIGGHGDTTMIPLVRLASYRGVSVEKLLSKETLDKVVKNTMVGGASLTALLGTSAWYAPGAAGALVVASILHDQKKVLPCSVALEGEYGQSDLCIGVPVQLGRNGVEKIIDLSLDATELGLFNASADAVRSVNDVLHRIKAL
jgi:malate dehydrogenase